MDIGDFPTFALFFIELMSRRIVFTIIVLVCAFGALSLRAEGFALKVVTADLSDGEVLPYCAVAIKPGEKSLMTDGSGELTVRLNKGRYDITAGCLGYEKAVAVISVKSDTTIILSLKPEAKTLGEVVITAKESDGLATSSKIGRDAMEHLQPTSFTDLLELLPGNISKTPSMGSANTISLRETGNLGASGQEVDNPDYAMSSLGTLFMVDGAPLASDANLQTVGTSTDASSPSTKRSVLNKGVDMRTISTDNIESVEIVRGIPSAEYGNLTSGMVNIKRISKPTPLTARFKADEYSKLLSVGKGFAIGDHITTVDFGWLDSKVDPRDNLENYRRLTASARAMLNFINERSTMVWRIGGDFTGSFDDTKVDPDLSLLKIDEYKASYRRMSLNNNLNVKFNDRQIVSELDFTFAASLQLDRLTRRKQVAPTHASIAPGSTSQGVNDGTFMLGEYVADYLCDGRPLDLFAKVKASGSSHAGLVRNDYMAGVEWTFAKNYGRGQVYDLSKPLSASWTTRPRSYRSIPSLQQLSVFVEDKASMPVGECRVEGQAGVRMQMLPAIDRRYYLSGKPYFDPRVNLTFHTPEFNIASRKASLLLAAGYGLTTKMPTIDYLYPQESYNDFVQLAYYDTNDPLGLSRVNLMTYIDSAVNYQLRAARNNKREVRIGFTYGGNELSVTYFNEAMNSGYRYTSVYIPYEYRKYDSGAIDPSGLTSPPDINRLPYEDVKVLDSKRKADNGTRIDKQGIEFQLTTARWKPLCTSLMINGAWFRTRYSNSQMLYLPVNEVIDGTALNDRFVGIYDSDDGRINEQFNTNFMFDTQLPRLGLVFSTTLQCMWWVKTTRMWQNGVPVAFVSSEDGSIKPFTQAEADDAVLKHLIKYYNEESFRPQRIPPALYLNFKATKKIGKVLKVAVFVNRIIDYLPNYTSNGLTIRRNSDAYFGMELNFSLN